MDDAIAKVANMADEVKDQALKDPERFVHFYNSSDSAGLCDSALFASSQPLLRFFSCRSLQIQSTNDVEIFLLLCYTNNLLTHFDGCFGFCAMPLFLSHLTSALTSFFSLGFLSTVSSACTARKHTK